MRQVTSVMLSAIIAVSLGAFACQRAEDRYLKRQVERNESVGLWVMTTASVKDLAGIGHVGKADPQKHTIVLREDGSCQFNTFASAVGADGKTNPLVERQCQWSIREVVGRQVLLLDMIGEPSLLVRFNFGEHQGSLALWQHADDPDAWRYIDYVKQ